MWKAECDGEAARIANGEEGIEGGRETDADTEVGDIGITVENKS
jgi:hypothetical protein